MKHFYFSLALSALVVTAAWIPTLALADDIMPPPEVQDSAANDAGVDVSEEPTDLHDELKTPGKDDNVEVRNYQRKDGAKITEYASHGHVYMVKVQPTGGLPAYYLYDENGNGKFERRLPGGYKRISPPSWVIKRF